MLMKKILATIMVLLYVLTASSAAPALSLSEGNIDGITVYAPDGRKLDPLTDVGESGMVIRTGEASAAFVSDYGDIHLDGNTLLAVTGFDIESPSLYLVYGGMNVIKKDDLIISVFTPASRTSIMAGGEYAFVSTDEAESFANISDSTVTAYDAIRGTETAVGPMEEIDYLAWPRSVSGLSEDDLMSISVTGVLPSMEEAEEVPEAEAPAEEMAEEEVPAEEIAGEEAVSREYRWGGYTLTAVIADGKAVLTYPAIVSNSDAEAFFAAENSRYDLAGLGVRYSFGEPGTAAIAYPSEYTAEEAASMLDILAEDLIAYLTAPAEEPEVLTEEPEEPAVPSAPSMLEPESVIETPSAPSVAYEIVSIEEPSPSAPEIAEPQITVAPAVPSAPSIISPVITIVQEPEAQAAEEAGEPVSAAVEIPAEEMTETEAPAAEETEVPAAETEAPAAEAAGTAEEAAGAPAEDPAIAETAGEESRIFDLRLGTRAYGNQRGDSLIGVSLMPSISLGSFTFTLSIDPFAIIAAQEYSTVPEWLGFAMDFIHEISYSSDSVRLSIARDGFLPGDAAGLFTGLDHAYDGKYSALSLDHAFTSEYYSHRLWFDDLAFRRLAGDDQEKDHIGNGGFELTVGAGSIYPITLTLGAAASVNIDDAKASAVYPEASLYIPFIWKNGVDFGLELAGAAMLRDDFSANPFTANGYLVSAALPVRFDGFTFEAGVAWSEKNMHYGMIGNTAYEPEPGSYLTVRALASYERSFFGIMAQGWLDIDLDTMGLSADNSYVEAAAYADLWGVRFFGGYRTQLSSPLTDCQFYGGLGADLGPLSSAMRMNYSFSSGFSLTLAASTSLIGNRRAESDYASDIPFRADLETGFEYSLGVEDAAPLFTVTPRIFIGNDDYSIAFRAPFRMHYEGGRFVLGGFNGHYYWDFGTSESNARLAIYRAITDSFALIDSISLGKEDSSIAYLLAERGYLRDGTLFTEFGTEDALSVRAGFNFPNLALSIYLDNAEAPHIAEGGLTFYPGSYNGFSLSFMVPGEILIEDLTTYALMFYPELLISIPFADRSFEFSLYALGEISTVYENGKMAESRIFYDFTDKKMYDYMAGAKFMMDLDTVGFTLEGGIRSGRLSPDMFTSLSALRNQTAGDSLSDVLVNLSAESGMKYFAKASFDLDLGFFGFSAAYSAGDLLGFADGSPDDYIALAISGCIDESVSLYASFAKKDFASSLTEKTEFMDYISNDALFSLGADFSFGHVGFSAELRTEFPEKTGNYINVPAIDTSEPSVSMTIKTRLVF